MYVYWMHIDVTFLKEMHLNIWIGWGFFVKFLVFFLGGGGLRGGGVTTLFSNLVFQTQHYGCFSSTLYHGSWTFLKNAGFKWKILWKFKKIKITLAPECIKKKVEKLTYELKHNSRKIYLVSLR